ncbi:MAG: DEAD/DEAH box helicase, partial [Candidatus Wallbacteria bacterium]|nr:DEAD/DEAH box helicase [Candidatus Wallbacteria bacterium]
MKFTELNLPDHILESLRRMGYTDLTPIQEATYPVIFSGRDLCALAETGSGKTAACVIPLVQMVSPAVNDIQGLIIVPTRELCIQYVGEIEKIAANSGVIAFAMFGGLDRKFNISRLKKTVHVLVATPGRLIDLMYEGALNFPSVKCVILDEADELLNEGFIDDVRFILSCVTGEHQTMLFSATMADDIRKLADECMREPEYISLVKEQASPESIEHCFIMAEPRQKMNMLISLFKEENVGQAIIFCNARHRVDRLHKELGAEVSGVECIHGGMSQDRRTSIIRRFRQNRIRYMVATDVAGRGLDFSHVTHVINWDFPDSADTYIHRTGRVGRMGRIGKA